MADAVKLMKENIKKKAQEKEVLEQVKRYNPEYRMSKADMKLLAKGVKNDLKVNKLLAKIKNPQNQPTEVLLGADRVTYIRAAVHLKHKHLIISLMRHLASD